MDSSDEALYVCFGLGHSKSNVTANMETISGFSFGGHEIGKPRFTKIRSVEKLTTLLQCFDTVGWVI